MDDRLRNCEVCGQDAKGCAASRCIIGPNPVRDSFVLMIEEMRAENEQLRKERTRLSMKLVTLERELEDNKLIARQLERFIAVVEIISGVALVKLIGRGVARFFRAWNPKRRFARDVFASTLAWVAAYNVNPHFWPAAGLFMLIWMPAAVAFAIYDRQTDRSRREHLHAYLLKDKNL